MKIYKRIGFLGMLLLPFIGWSQNVSVEATYPNETATSVEGSELSAHNLAIKNQEGLEPFFEELALLDEFSDRKLRIVHIGDSHIQAGYFPRKARQMLQERFGNAGIGFTFPYRLAKSNGIKEVKFSSNINWEGKRNIHATELDPVGISGFGLTTQAKEFLMQLTVEDEQYLFDNLKLFTPDDQAVFDLAKNLKEVNMQKFQTENKTHKARSGEFLGKIARMYGVTVAQIKSANGLKNDNIRAGASLKIPVKTQKAEPINRADFDIILPSQNIGYYDYHFNEPQSSVWLLPSASSISFTLNGVVLEKNNAGIIYNGIGVNGARFADYNKTGLFFKQLAAIQPDLMIVSLGTNEAFDDLDPVKYRERLEEFITHLRQDNPQLSIVMTTPPPSLIKRSRPNMRAEEYAQLINEIAEDNNIAVWDLYEVLGGNKNASYNYQRGFMARDYVHYTEAGYEYSAEMFTEALLNAYQNYLTRHKK